MQVWRTRTLPSNLLTITRIVTSHYSVILTSYPAPKHVPYFLSLSSCMFATNKHNATYIPFNQTHDYFAQGWVIRARKRTNKQNKLKMPGRELPKSILCWRHECGNSIGTWGDGHSQGFEAVTKWLYFRGIWVSNTELQLYEGCWLSWVLHL